MSENWVGDTLILDLKTVIENETGHIFNKQNQICCPFHKEGTPSFTIFKKGDKEKYKCFGCGEYGDIIDFIRKFKSLDYIDAVNYLNLNGYNFKLINIPNIKVISYINWQLNNIENMRDFELIELYKFKDSAGEIKYYKAKFKADKGKQCRYYSIVKGKVKCERASEELPYNLYGLAKSKSNTVYIVEGEKDVETLLKMGYIAVSLKNFKYDKYNCRFFKNKNIIIVPDNDSAGIKYKNEVLDGLKPYIKSFKEFPINQHAKESGQDITDLINLKYLDKEQFENTIDKINPNYTYIYNGKLIAVRLARIILSCEDIIYSKNEGFFHYENDYYRLIDELDMMELISKYLDDIFNITRIKSEILKHIMEQTKVEHIATANEYLNFKNCLLKVTKEGIQETNHTPDIITIHRFDYEFEKVDYKSSRYYEGVKYALDENMKIVEFLKQSAGACLMPNASLIRSALIIVGSRGTGKSTFIEPIQEMMKGLYSSYDLKTIEEDKFALAYLIDKKCILSTEDSGKALDTCGRLKKLIFGESITSDKKNKEPVNLNLNLNIIMGMNDIPKFNDNSNAIFDRLNFVQFKKQIRGTEKEDPHFIENIKKNEMIYVINFALDGLLDLLRNNYKLNIPKEVQDVKETVISDNNSFENWFHNCIENVNDDFEVLKLLYDSYLGYCLSELSIDFHEAKKGCSKQQMSNSLESKGITLKKQFKKSGSNYKNAFIGIKLNETGTSNIFKGTTI